MGTLKGHRLVLSQLYIQGTHGTGKMEKENPCQGICIFCQNSRKTQGIFPKHGILLAQVVNALILKVKDIAIFAENKFFPPGAG